MINYAKYKNLIWYQSQSIWATHQIMCTILHCNCISITITILRQLTTSVLAMINLTTFVVVVGVDFPKMSFGQCVSSGPLNDQVEY